MSTPYFTASLFGLYMYLDLVTLEQSGFDLCASVYSSQLVPKFLFLCNRKFEVFELLMILCSHSLFFMHLTELSQTTQFLITCIINSISWHQHYCDKPLSLYLACLWESVLLMIFCLVSSVSCLIWLRICS